MYVLWLTRHRSPGWEASALRCFGSNAVLTFCLFYSNRRVNLRSVCSHMQKSEYGKQQLAALQGQGRLRFTCLVVQLIKQLDCFQDSSTPALSFVFLCHYFYGKKKDLFPWNSEVVNLYFAWNKNIFCKWNAYGNTPASSVCLVC